MSDEIRLGEAQEQETRARSKAKACKVVGAKTPRPTGFEEDVEYCVQSAIASKSRTEKLVDKRAETILQQVYAMAAANAVKKAAGTLDTLLRRCESEIEKQFLLALFAVAQENVEVCIEDLDDWGIDQNVFVAADMDRYLEAMVYQVGPTPIGIMVQAQVGKYRADLVLYGISVKSDEPSKWLRVPLVVECDGHDFHEKTKEQAKRDKRRDRDLMSKGFHVLRFTGSEIFNAPKGCADEAVHYVSRLLNLHHMGKLGGFSE